MDRFTEYSLIWVILGIAGVINGIIGFDAFFKRRHRLILNCIYFTAKNSFAGVASAAVIYRNDLPMINTVLVIVNTVCAVLSFIVLWYTWVGEPIKIGIAGIFSDMISGTSMIAGASIMNVIRGRSNEHAFLYLSIMDAVCVTLISICIYYLVVRLTRKPIRQIREYEIRHRRLMTIAIIIVIAGLSSSNIGVRTDIEKALSVSYSLGLMAMIIALIFLIGRIRHQIRKKEALSSRAEIREAYMNAIKMQSANIEMQENLLNSIREKINIQESDNRREDMSEYLEMLRAQAESLRRGSFSASPSVDAVLSVFDERMIKNGWKTSFRVADVNGCEEKTAEISMNMLKWAETVCNRTSRIDDKDRQVNYRVSREGNQILFDLILPAKIVHRFHKRMLEGYISEYDPVTDARDNSERRISVMTEVTG